MHVQCSYSDWQLIMTVRDLHKEETSADKVFDWHDPDTFSVFPKVMGRDYWKYTTIPKNINTGHHGRTRLRAIDLYQIDWQR